MCAQEVYVFTMNACFIEHEFRCVSALRAIAMRTHTRLAALRLPLTVYDVNGNGTRRQSGQNK